MSPVATRTVADVIAKVTTVVSPPVVYQRLVEVINDPRSGPADVARVISEDSGLTARLLKLVNSSLFSFPQRIGSVVQAVQVVGTAQVRDLTLATSIMSTFKDVPEDLVDMESFWKHSLACGMGARVLASHRNENNVERFFVAGLLHDVGRLILYQLEGEGSAHAVERSRSQGRMLYDTEREVFGFDHAQIGGALMTQWNFPICFKQAVAFHHTPSLADMFPVETAAVHIADLMANALWIGSSGERMVPPLSPAAWDMMGIDSDLTPVLLDDMERQYKDAVHIQLGIDA